MKTEVIGFAKKSLAAGLVASVLLVGGSALLTPTASAPGFLKPQEASAATWDCVSVARNAFRVMAGSVGAKFVAFVRALRSSGGCGATAAATLCWVSRQWWGGWARTLVRWATYGKYSTC